MIGEYEGLILGGIGANVGSFVGVSVSVGLSQSTLPDGSHLNPVDEMSHCC